MVGEGRKNLLTHLILLIIIPIILFPIIWVVSTSIRRDEAAFSTKLFSSRLTLQHYIDLVAPEKNIPVLVQEIQNLVLRTPPYNKWDEKRIKKLIDEDLRRLQDYVKETQERYENSKKLFNKVNNFLTSKNEDIKSKTLSILLELKDFLERKIPKEEAGRIEIEKYNNLKVLKERFSKISERINKNLMEINRIKNRYSSLQESILNINKEFSYEINPKIELINKKLTEETNVIPASFFQSKNKNLLSKSLEILKNLTEKVEGYPDLSQTLNDLKNLHHNLEYNWNPFSPQSKEIYFSIKELDSKISMAISMLENNIRNLKEEERKLALLEQENEFLEIQRELLGTEMEEEEEELKPISKYSELKTFLKNLDGKIKEIEDAKNFKDLVIVCVPLEEEFRNFVSEYILSFDRDELVGKIESAVDKLRWFQEYNTFLNKFEFFSKNLNNTIEKTKIYLSDLSLTGKSLNPNLLDTLYDIAKTDYVNLVSPNMNIVSKKAGDLIDLLPYKDVKGDLKGIDGELFRIDQVWKQKTRHYFLRWVRNSIFVAGISAIITTIVCSIAAYPFSRLRFWGRKYGIMTLLLIQMFPSAVYMIAIYSLLNLLGKFVPFLGLDTLTGLTFVYLGNIAYNMYIIKGFYDTIPDSLEESAMIDGATRFQTFYKIVIPLARPILAVVIILTFMGVFNEFIFARIILRDAKNYTYAIGLWTFSSGPYLTEWGLFTAAALLGMLPMTILFLSLQRYIVSGLTKGAVKG